MCVNVRVVEFLEDDCMKPSFVFMLVLLLGSAALLALITSCEPGKSATDTSSEESATRLQIGDEVPDYHFTNQAGEAISLHRLQPKAVLVTFIFTRCSAVDFCPRMSQKFREVREALDELPWQAQVELLSVTLDPEHDTPEVLSTYAAHLGARPGSWTFATCPPADLDLVKQSFSMRAAVSEQTGTIDHNLVTALIAPDGRVRQLWEGNQWTLGEVLESVSDVINRPKL